LQNLSREKNEKFLKAKTLFKVISKDYFSQIKNFSDIFLPSQKKELFYELCKDLIKTLSLL
jgi:hypothetical protein